MNDIAFKVIIKNDGIDDVIFKTLMLKGEKGDKGDAGGAEIDDSTTSASKTWSSNKIRAEIDAKPVNLSQLGDVDLDTITDGQMLGYNLTAGKWENKTADASSLKYDANTSIKDKIDAKADSAGLSVVAVSGAYNDLSNKPQLADVATSGDYDDLSNKPTIPDELNDMTDVDISGQTSGEALVWDGTKWTNGSVSSVGSIDDLSDVDTTGKSAGDCLRYDGSEWISEKQVIELTQAEYDALQSKQPNTLYVITDAQNLNATADDIEYSAGVSVADALDSLDNLNDYILKDYSSNISSQWGVITSSGCYAMKKGNIGIITVRIKTSASIESGTLTLSDLPFASTRETWGALSSLDGKGGFIALNGKDLLIRCGASSSQFLAGQVVVPIS